MCVLGQAAQEVAPRIEKSLLRDRSMNTANAVVANGEDGKPYDLVMTKVSVE